MRRDESLGVGWVYGGRMGPWGWMGAMGGMGPWRRNGAEGYWSPEL